MGKPTGFLDYEIKKNRNFREHAAWPAASPSASQV